MAIPTHFSVCEAHYFFYAAALEEIRTARGNIAWESCIYGSSSGRAVINLIARLENTIALGCRSSDFASPGPASFKNPIKGLHILKNFSGFHITIYVGFFKPSNEIILVTIV